MGVCPPASAGDVGSIPGPGTFPVGQSSWAHGPQLLSWHGAAAGFLRFWLRLSSLLCGFALAAVSQAPLQLPRGDFSSWWLFLWQSWALGLMTLVLEALRLSRSAACGIFPGQGSNPCPSSWAGRFLTTGPPGKSLEALSHPSPWTPLLPDPVGQRDEGRWPSGQVCGAVVTNSNIRISPTRMDLADFLSASSLLTASEPRRLLCDIIRRKTCFYR